MPDVFPLKEKVLALITRRQPCPSTPMLQNFPKVKAPELQQILHDLAREGRIEIWKNGRKTLYTVAGAPNPFPVGQPLSQNSSKNEEKPEAPAPPKHQRTVRRRPSDPSGYPSPDTTALIAAITDLEARRSAALDTVEKIDAALSSLRALA